MEGGGCEVEGSVQPSKSTSRVKEESQDVGPLIPSQLARFVFRGTDLMRNRGLSYLIYTRRVKFVFMCHDWCPWLHSHHVVIPNMSQTAKDLTAGTVGGIAQVKPPLWWNVFVVKKSCFFNARFWSANLLTSSKWYVTYEAKRFGQHLTLMT